MSDTKAPPQGRKNLWAILVALCMVWGANQWHLHGLEQELETLALDKVKELSAPDQGAQPEGRRIAAEVVVSKPYIFFGQPTGKISVYMEQTLGGESPNIMGIEYFYLKDPRRSWTEMESGACTSDQCVIDGKELLEKTYGAKPT